MMESRNAKTFGIKVEERSCRMRLDNARSACCISRLRNKWSNDTGTETCNVHDRYLAFPVRRISPKRARRCRQISLIPLMFIGRETPYERAERVAISRQS